MPTSKARGVFIGLVELNGTAEAAAPVRSFLAEQACVQFRYSIDERWSRTVIETYRDDKGQTRTRTRTESGWTALDRGGEAIPFYVRDDTGAVLVRPEGARLEPRTLCSETVSRGHPLYYAKGPAGAVAHSDGVRRFVEDGIPLHCPLFVVGVARERADVVAPEIAAARDAELFLISTHPEQRVLRGYGIGSWVTWALGLAAAVVAGGVWRAHQGPSAPPWPLVAGGAAFLALWALGWIGMAYNSLVALRERVRQGWSLIDVQLKRRHDLIPALVAAVSALGRHERELQTALAVLRAQAAATPPGVAGPDFHGLAGTLRVVAERHPPLAAAPEFLRLQQQLTETEQRIALARSYYNDVATFFATRLEQVPDRWVARLGRMRPEPLLGAEDFERAPVSIEFAAATP